MNDGAQVGLQPGGICGSAGIGGGRRPRQHESSQAGAHATGQGGGQSLGNGLSTPAGISDASPAKAMIIIKLFRHTECLSIYCSTLPAGMDR